MMKILKKAQERTEEDRKELSRMVQEIIDNVRGNGDEALRSTAESLTSVSGFPCAYQKRRSGKLICSFLPRR